jgi:uncharacterized protein YegJ (DUF2314 family)
MSNWTGLADATERARLSRLFEIPPREDRDSLRPGDYVKVIFETALPGRPGERMWLLVDGRTADGDYVGTLTNRPVIVTGVEQGDSVEFGVENVIDIIRGKA